MNMAFKSRPEGFSAEKAFEESFAGALHISKDEYDGESCEYWNPFNRVNKIPFIVDSMKEKAINRQKASIDTQTGGAGTAGTALIPVYVDATIVDRTIRETPFRNMTPRRAIRGQTYDYIPLTAKGGAVWGLENQAIADQIDTYNRTSVFVKFLYAKGRISGPSIASMRGFIDPQSLDLSVKTVSIMEAEEEALINGDASTNPEEPDGAILSITTNTTNRSNAYPTLALLRAETATSFNSNGVITVAITDASTHDYIKGLMQDFQRTPVVNPSMDMLGFGIPGAFDFDGVMYIRDKFMPTASGSRRILFLDMRYIFIAVLQDLTYEVKASENDSEVYMLKEYITPVFTFEASSTMMYGIT